MSGVSHSPEESWLMHLPVLADLVWVLFWRIFLVTLIYFSFLRPTCFHVFMQCKKQSFKKTTDRNQKYSFKFLVHQVNLSNKCMLCVGKIWENSKNSINFIRKIYRDQQHKRHIWYQTIGSTLKMHCFLG